MPVIKSAKKKLRQDKKRTLLRAKTEVVLKDAVKKAVTSPTAKNVSAASSLLDKAAKKHIIHKNKAARVKSRLAHLLSPKSSVKAAAPAGQSPLGGASKAKTVKKPATKSTAKAPVKKSPAKKK